MIEHINKWDCSEAHHRNKFAVGILEYFMQFKLCPIGLLLCKRPSSIDYYYYQYCCCWKIYLEKIVVIKTSYKSHAFAMNACVQSRANERDEEWKEEALNFEHNYAVSRSISTHLIWNLHAVKSFPTLFQKPHQEYTDTDTHLQHTFQLKFEVRSQKLKKPQCQKLSGVKIMQIIECTENIPHSSTFLKCHANDRNAHPSTHTDREIFSYHAQTSLRT